MSVPRSTLPPIATPLARLVARQTVAELHRRLGPALDALGYREAEHARG